MRFRSIFLAASIALVPATLIAPTAAAETAQVYTGRFSNVAVQGHDPVAYFTAGEPTKGSKDFSTTYQGAEFRFASQENLDTFVADPEAYAPQYGGYCAWAVSQGYTAKGDADHWRIVDGKLYLNYNAKVQRDWEADIPGFIEQADTEWPVILAR